LILNKDTNPNASGIVQVKTHDITGMDCIYFTSGGNLSAINGFNIGGLSFVGNYSFPVGNFNSTWVSVGDNGYYNIPLGFAEAVLCQTRI
jgi:hypothetical protein